MINPVLTLFFNLFLVGSALAILAAMVQEYRISRRASVGRGGAATRARVTRASGREERGSLRRAA